MLFDVSTVLLSVIVVILYVVFKSIAKHAVTLKWRMDTMKEIPSEKRHWFFGHARYFTPDEQGMMRELESLKRFPKYMQRWFGPLQGVILGYQPDIAKTVYTSKSQKTFFSKATIRHWIGDGLVTSNGEKWKRARRLLTPIFHSHSLKRYLPCVNDATMRMMNKWESNNTESVELFHEVGVMTLDSLLRCMLSKDSGCESGENLTYLKAVKTMTKSITARQKNPLHYIDAVYFRTSAGRKFTQAVKIAHEFTENAIRERCELMKFGKNKTSEFDFLDILLQAKDENGKGLTHQEIRDELDTFVFAGHDTVTSGISWALYNMAQYPDMQEICRKEVVSVLNGGKRVEWEHLSKLEYLTKFIKESMRIYPPLGMVIRRTIETTTFPDELSQEDHTKGNKSRRGENAAKTFPKDSLLSVGIFLLHHNPTVWENPEVFDPERFNQENVAQRSPHAYVPFSTGSRNCIGQNFALNEMKVVLAIALLMFRFTVDSSYSKPERQIEVILHSKTGIHLRIQKLEE